MDQDFEIFSDFNEYRQIIPKSVTRNHIEALIDKEFENSEELLLCIVESVTLGNIKGIGTTHLRYFNESDENLKKMIEEYWSIINRLKGEMKGISSYFSWYQRENSYYIIGKNTGATIPVIFDNGWAIIDKQEKVTKDYITIIDSELSDVYVRKYLTRYVELFKEKKWFKNLPHYAIFIKPISVPNPKTGRFIPLGNFYLHFGTKTPLPLESYKNLVNKLLLVWFNRYGATLIGEIAENGPPAEEKISDKYKPLFTEPKHVDKISTNKIPYTDLTHEKLYCMTFDNAIYQSYISENLIDHTHKSLEHITSIGKKMFKLEYDQYQTSIEGHLGTIKDLSSKFMESTLHFDSKTKEEVMVQKFIKLLSARRILLAYYLVGGLSVKSLNRITFKFKDNTDEDNIKTRIWNKYFIPVRRSLEYTFETLGREDQIFLNTLVKHLISQNEGYILDKNNFIQNLILESVSG